MGSTLVAKPHNITIDVITGPKITTDLKVALVGNTKLVPSLKEMTRGNTQHFPQGKLQQLIVQTFCRNEIEKLSQGVHFRIKLTTLLSYV